MKNYEQLIDIRNNWMNTLESVFQRKSKSAIYLNGTIGVGKSDPYIYPELWVNECIEDIKQNKAQLIDDNCQFRPIAVEYGIYGVHFIDKILGAHVYYKDGQWYNDYLTTPIGSLKMPDLKNNETFNLAIRAAKAFKESGDKFCLFGMPTLSSALNIAVNLYGQEILVELLVDAENAIKDLRIINDIILECHKAMKETVDEIQLQPVISWNRTQPPGYGQVCGCTTQLISKELYEEIFAALDSEILSLYKKGGMLHLCGSHLQHVETFKNMKCLKAIQVNDRAAEDLEGYFKGLRDDQIIYLNPCEGMTVKRAKEITGGERLVIAADNTECECGCRAKKQTAEDYRLKPKSL